MFVDDDGLLRRLTMDMSMEAMGQPLSTKVSMDYFDFGVDVDVAGAARTRRHRRDAPAAPLIAHLA